MLCISYIYDVRNIKNCKQKVANNITLKVSYSSYFQKKNAYQKVTCMISINFNFFLTQGDNFECIEKISLPSTLLDMQRYQGQYDLYNIGQYLKNDILEYLFLL